MSKNIVEHLWEPFERTNRSITFDNYFKNYKLLNSLLSKGLFYVITAKVYFIHRFVCYQNTTTCVFQFENDIDYTSVGPFNLNLI